MAQVIDTGAMRRMEAMFDRIRSELPKQLQTVSEVMAGEAASRAPTPQEEYQTMMLGDGNPESIYGVPELPSGPEVAPDKRMRFYKSQESYLQNVVAGSYKVEGLLVCVGEVAALNAASIYQWQNVDGSLYSSTYPFWESFESGMVGSFYISPVHPQKRNPPTLTPGVGKDNQRYFMFKQIHGRHMYGGVNIDNYVKGIIIPEIQRLARQG
jgi:hypothetical protein